MDIMPKRRDATVAAVARPLQSSGSLREKQGMKEVSREAPEKGVR